MIERLVDADAVEAIMEAARTAYRRAALLVADRLPAANLVAAAGQVISDAEWGELLEDVNDQYGDLYLDAVVAGGIALGILPPDAEIIGKLDEQEQSAAHLASILRDIINDLFADALRDQLNSATLRRNILDGPGSPLSVAKAETFARTAAAAAVNGGFRSAYKAAGVPAVSWITQRDDKVRDAHVTADRDVVPIDQPFTVGGHDAWYPGDPSLPIGLRINCRCVLGWVDGDQTRKALDATHRDLYKRARDLDVKGRSKMRKADLQAAVIQQMCLQGLSAGVDCPDRFTEMNMATLLVHARRADIPRRYRMRRHELVDAVTTAYRQPVPTGVVFAVDPVEFAFDPSQPRHPSGTRSGGRWRSDYEWHSGRPTRTFPAGSRPGIWDEDRASRWHAERDRLSSYETQRQVFEPATREQREQFGDRFGVGIESVFGEGTAPTTTVPFPAASRRKDKPLYDRDAVAHALAQDVRLTAFDPRTLRSTQRGVTRPGVEFYTSGQYESTGSTYADQHVAGNRHPVVYRNPDNGQLLILSGHHRAVAALVQGKPLNAIFVDPRVTVIRTPSADLPDH